MIKYKLICKNCDLSFDSWFASSNEYEKLKKKNFLNCIKCNSKKVEKNLMAPKVINKSPKIKIEKNDLKFSEIDKKIKEYQKIKSQNKLKNIVIGFGITENTIKSLKKADGLVVGSAICKEITKSIKKRQNTVTNVTNVVRKLKEKIK